MKNHKTKFFLSFLFAVLSLSSHHLMAQDKTTAATSPMKDCDSSLIASCFQDRQTANHGFRIVKKDNSGKVVRTKYVALLLHGLSDSPYFYRDIAKIIFEKGINVLAIRNTGHGTLKKHLGKTKRKEWYADVTYGMQKASELGENIIVAGMSLGGALAVREAQLNPQVKGLILLSPAIKMPKRMAIACTMTTPIIRWPLQGIGSLFTDTSSYQARKEYGKDVRYSGIHNKGTCQLRRINNEIERRGGFEKINAPVFNVVSEYDGAIDKEFVINFSSQVGSNKEGKSHLILYKDPSQEFAWNLPQISFAKEVPCMRHASVLLRPSAEMGYDSDKCEYTSSKEIKQFNSEETHDFSPEINHHFEILEEGLNRFLDQNFS
jgi:esterase/lipase